MSDRSVAVSSGDPERAAGAVPDLDKKLDYLIRARGDRRQGEAKRKRLVHVTTQDALAQELGIASSTITRWRDGGHIAKLSFYTPLIARIFDCDDQSFRNDDYATFRGKCEANRIGWERLVHGAPVVFDAIRPEAADPPAWGARKAGPEGDELIDRGNLPVVAPGQGFRVEFRSPRDADGGVLWAGWHVLMFNGDRDGYLNWIPRRRATAEFKDSERFPGRLGSILVPRPGGRLTSGRQAWGEHDVVLVVSRDRIPPELEAELEKPLMNAALEPTLDLLAAWLAERMAGEAPEAAIVRGPFFVGPVTLATAVVGQG